MDDMNNKNVENNDDPFAKLRPSKEPTPVDEKAIKKRKKRNAILKYTLLGLLIIISAYIFFVPPGVKLYLGTNVIKNYRMKIELSRYDQVEGTIAFHVDGDYVRISEGDYVNSFSSDLYWNTKDDKIYVWSGFHNYDLQKVLYRRVDATRALLNRPTVSTTDSDKDIFNSALSVRPTNSDNANVIEDYKMTHMFGKYTITGKIMIENKYYNIKITIDRIGFTNVKVPWNEDDYK